MIKSSDLLFEANELYLEEEYQDCIPFFEECLGNKEEEAATFLGLIYENGYSVDEDRGRALKYYLQGVSLGSVRSMYYAAILFGDEGDFDSALRLLKAAASQNFVRAQALLGFFFREGPYNYRNKEQAKIFLKEASDNGHFLAKGAYANILWRTGKMTDWFVAYSLIPRFFYRVILRMAWPNDDESDIACKSIVKRWRNLMRL